MSNLQAKLMGDGNFTEQVCPTVVTKSLEYLRRVQELARKQSMYALSLEQEVAHLKAKMGERAYEMEPSLSEQNLQPNMLGAGAALARASSAGVKKQERARGRSATRKTLQRQRSALRKAPRKPSIPKQRPPPHRPTARRDSFSQGLQERLRIYAAESEATHTGTDPLSSDVDMVES